MRARLSQCQQYYNVSAFQKVKHKTYKKQTISYLKHINSLSLHDNCIGSAPLCNVKHYSFFKAF